MTEQSGEILHSLRVDIADAVATVVLNRPEALNAQNTQMKSELAVVIKALARDRDVRAVIITHGIAVHRGTVKRRQVFRGSDRLTQHASVRPGQWNGFTRQRAAVLIDQLLGLENGDHGKIMTQKMRRAIALERFRPQDRLKK